jgi:hypothetical protein
VLRPRTLAFGRGGEENRKVQVEGLSAHQVVGVVRAHQADDGSLV